MDTRYLDPAGTEDFAARTRELASLQDLIRKPFTKDQVTEWSSLSPLRAEIVGNTVWGRIRWLKSYGRPLGPALASGFSIDHRFYDEFTFVDENHVLKTVSAWYPASPLSTWEMDDEDHYILGFLTYQAPAKTNRVEVRFAESSLWELASGTVGSRHLWISPPSRTFEAMGKAIVLEEFVVVPLELRPDR